MASIDSSTAASRYVSAPLWLAVFVFLSTAIRIVAQWMIPGFLQGDDLEIVQEALRPLLGLDAPPWAIRHLALPHLLVRPFAAGAIALGASGAQTLIFVASVPFILLSALNIVLVFLLAKKWTEERAAIIAAGLYSFHWIPLVYGTGGFPRVVSVTCVLSAALLLTRPAAWRGLLAGVVFSLALAARYSEIVFALPLAWMLLDRDRRIALTAAFTGGTLAGIAALGWYDAIIWGEPFRSLVEFGRFTLIERESSSLDAVQGPLWYFGRAHQWLPIPALLAARYVPERVGRMTFAFLVLPLIALSLIHHKEVRYLQAMIPFAAIFAGSALAGLRDARRTLGSILTIVTLLWGLFGLRALEKRSSAAFIAASSLAIRHSCTVVPQPWAFGDRIFIRGELRSVGTAPTVEKVLDAAPGCLVLLYRSETPDPMVRALDRAGCHELGTFTFRRSRPVVTFDCFQSHSRGSAPEP